MSGGLVYVANSGPLNLNITGFRLDAQGILRPMLESSVHFTSSPEQVEFSPGGGILAATQSGADQIRTFAVQGDGTLREAPGSPFSTSGSVNGTPIGGNVGFSFTQSGSHLLLSGFTGHTVTPFGVDGATGALAPPNATVPNDRTFPCWTALSPDGQALYTANIGDATVSAYGVSADESTLSFLGSTPRPTSPGSNNAAELQVSPGGQFVYLVAPTLKQLRIFAIGADRNLTETGGSPFNLNSGQSSMGIAVRIPATPLVAWAPTAFQFDGADPPAVAISGSRVVEVHEGGGGPLWYSTGPLQSDGTVQWGGSAPFDNGSMPALAIASSTAIEVHQGAPGTLWYSTGPLQPNGTVQWGGSVQYDNGSMPALAASGSTVIEVHQATTGVGHLWYRTGVLQSNGTVQWGGSFQYDNGSMPSVAISGSTVVEVHQWTAGVGPLWYRSGALQPNGTVQWINSFQYDNGAVPSIAISGGTVVEVHQAAAGVGPLWYRNGALQASGIVQWAGSHLYDNGAAPAIAMTGPAVVEVHLDAAGSGLLWYHPGALP